MTRKTTPTGDRIDFDRRTLLKATGAAGIGLTGLGAISGSAMAAPGDPLGTVELANTGDGVGLTFTGDHVIVPDGFNTATIDVYDPVQSGSTSQVATKTVTDTSGNDLRLNAIEWDPVRGMLWGANNSGGGPLYLIDIGDPTVSDTVQGTFEFNTNHPQGTFADGLAFDASTDTIWYSPDVRPTVHEYNMDGTVASTVTPELPNGDPINLVSGLAIGAELNGRRTLYVGENQAQANGNVRRVYADDGTHISDFTVSTDIRVEDLTCNPLTYNTESILVKHAYTKGQNSPGGSPPTLYRAFEVETGTCPLPSSCDPAVSVDLIADGGSPGSAVTIGTVTVSSSDADSDGDTELVVTYELTGDWYLRETHLHVAGDADEDGHGDCDRIPQNGGGNPKVGHFGLSRDYGPGVQTDTFVIERDAADNAFGETFSEGEALCIAAHAAVFEDMDGDGVYDAGEDREESAWSDGERFTDRGNWAMHFDYQNPCIENPFSNS